MTLFMDGVQLSQGYRATMKRQFTMIGEVKNEFLFLGDRKSKNCFFEYPIEDWISSAIVEKHLLKASAVVIRVFLTGGWGESPPPNENLLIPLPRQFGKIPPSRLALKKIQLVKITPPRVPTTW